MRFWSCWGVSIYGMVVCRGLEPSKGISCLRSDRVLTMDEEDRVDERPRDMIYCDPTVGAKCFYQNPKPWHNRVDMAEWIPNFTH